MNSFLDTIRRVTPYVPGEQPRESGIIKLNTNENPYPPAPGVERLLQGFDTDCLRKYPDSNVTPLVEALAKRYGVETSQVFVGVGSDDVLGMAFLTYFNSERPILFPDITYSFYDVWAKLYRIPYTQLPLDENFRIRPEDYRIPNGGIVIANPNAPTSIAEGPSFIEDILEHNKDSVVIVDEAYIDFGGVSSLPLLKKYPNLVVTQTFSKSRSMAGMRIGFAIASSELIQALNDVKQSYNSYTMNTTAILAGVKAVEDEEYFQTNCRKIMETREWTRQELGKIGFSMLDSSANFVFASHESVSAEQIFTKLKERKIYVRYFNKPRINNYLRISIGTREEMESLVTALKGIVCR